MARPRTYSDNAEKMRAYRERLRRDETPGRYETPSKSTITKPVTKLGTVTKPVTKPQAPSGHHLVRAVDAQVRKKGEMDSKALHRAIVALYGEHNLIAKLKAYRRALPEARAMDRCVNLVRQWGRSEPEWDAAPEAAPSDFVEDWFEIAGPARHARVRELINHQEQLWRTDDRRKLDRLRKYRDRMKADPQLCPPITTHRTTPGDTRGDRGNRLATAIMNLIQQKPDRLWKVSTLASKFRETEPTIRNVVLALIRYGKLMWIDKGKGLLGLPRPDIKTKSWASRRIIEMLIPAPAGIAYLQLEGAIGYKIVSAIATLRKLGVLEPGDFSRRAPIRLSADARDKIDRGHRIRDGRRHILWEPADADS
jgi:hypothetical protein